jgi:hypothetical protein
MPSILIAPSHPSHPVSSFYHWVSLQNSPPKALKYELTEIYFERGSNCALGLDL